MARSAKITAQVGRVGTTLKTVQLPEGSTVEDAIDAAGLRIKSSEMVRVDGNGGELEDELEDNAVILLVRDIEGGK
jgi:sulfur carrier protein ThiS